MTPGCQAQSVTATGFARRTLLRTGLILADGLPAILLQLGIADLAGGCSPLDLKTLGARQAGGAESAPCLIG